jgi:hypothetical protein
MEPLFPAAPSDRNIFLTGIHFFAGISTGSFLAMGLADCIFGFPVPIFRLIGSFLLCLVLCYSMVVFYDWQDMKLATQEVEQEDDREDIKLATQVEQEEEETALIGTENGSTPYALLSWGY